MQKKELLEIVAGFKDEYCIDLINFIQGDASARDTIDSFTFIKFVVLVEECKGIEFEEDKLNIACFENVDNLIDYINLLEEMAEIKEFCNDN